MKTLKLIVLLTVMLVNVTPYIKDGKVEWKTNEAAAQNYTYECESNFFQRLFGKHMCVNQDNEDDWFWGGTHECIKESYECICSKCNDLYECNSRGVFCNYCYQNVEMNALIYENGSTEFLDASSNGAAKCKFPTPEIRSDGFPYHNNQKVLQLYHTHTRSESQGYNLEPSPQDFTVLEAYGGKNHPTVVIGQVKAIVDNSMYLYFFDYSGSKVTQKKAN
jgi:hypothetical protein